MLFNEARVDTTLKSILIGEDSGHQASIVELALKIIGADQDLTIFAQSFEKYAQYGDPDFEKGGLHLSVNEQFDLILSK